AEDFTIAAVFATDSQDLGPASSEWHSGSGVVHSNQLGFAPDWGVSINANGRVGAGTGKGFPPATTTVFAADANRNDGERHTAIFTRSAGELTLYVDDAEPVFATGGNEAARGPLDFWIGDPFSVSKPFVGLISEVRVYNGALSANEVQKLQCEFDAYYNNELPVANPDAYSTAEDSLLAVTPTDGVLANDTDNENDALSAHLIEAASNGTVALNPSGAFIYTPNKNFFGVDSFTYAANDFRDSEPTTVTINVEPQYDAPFGVTDTYKTTPTSTLTVPAFVGVLQNDVNVDNAALQAVLQNDVSSGALNLSPDGSFTFDPQGVSGVVTFFYQIDDGTNVGSTTTASIVVNEAPKTVDDSYTATEDQPLIVAVDQGVLSNDSDREGTALVPVVVQQPARGILNFADNGSFIYTPNLNAFGTDSFRYFISDGTDDSEIASVTITVQAVNDLPVVNGETLFTLADTPLRLDAEHSLLLNDSDVEDQQDLSMTPVNKRSDNGSFVIEADGQMTYTPNDGFVGADSITYEVRDSAGGVSSGVVTVFVGESPVTLSEIMAANADTVVTTTRETPDGRFDSQLHTPDWIELRNNNSEPFDISGFHLTDNVDNPTKWAFPTDTVIPANSYLVVFASRLNITDPALDEHGYLHTNFKISHEAGQYLALTTPLGIVLDEWVDIPQQYPDVSYGRSPELGYQSVPTLGADNSDQLSGIVDGVTFSEERGFYDDALKVALEVATPDAQIYYTLNGSIPTQETGVLYTVPIDVSRTSNLRAAAFKPGMVPSSTGTQSYFFIEDILTQPADPAGFPARWGAAGAADYAMDPRVVSDTESPFYDPNVAEALRALPIISLTVDNEEFFGTRGIQSIPQSHGDEYEIATSVEFVGFDQFENMQIDSGIRMAGNASRNPDRRKHNMRLAFRDDYGHSSLELPLFGIGEGEAHENLILRGGNGDSWVNPGTAKRAQYIRDQWQRDMQIAMGHLTTQQLYSHLYINGLYWGLYHVFERHDASFMALHLGGDAEDYDAIKDVNGQTAAVEAVSGTTDGWEALFDIADDRDMDADDKYRELAERIDMDNMIDYLLLNFYAGNGDWDHNNFRTGRRKDGKFIFFSWDAERADINRSNDNSSGPLRVPDADIRLNVTTTARAGRPTRIHRQLTDSYEYRLHVADRMQKHLHNGGALTPDRVAETWNARADEIRLPLAAESARWGDLHSASAPRTVEHWESVLAVMNERFFPQRTDILISQMERFFGDFEASDAPQFVQHGGRLEANQTIAFQAIHNGTIYFTTDGSDPRLVGGDIAPLAQNFTAPFSVPIDSVVKARVLADGVWSPMTEATFTTGVPPADKTSIRISEIHYNPADPSDEEIAAGFLEKDDFEFIEIVNVSDHAIDVSNVRFALAGDDGIAFDFANADIMQLAAGDRVVIVEDISAFEARYGTTLPVAGQWSGRLSNNGETLTLLAGTEQIHQFAYDDAWHESTDGGGHSLEIVNVHAADVAAWADAESWQPSTQIGGSPGQESRPARIPGDSNGDGRFDSSDFVLVFQAAEYEDGIPLNSTFEEGDWNGDGDFNSQDFVFAFQNGNYRRDVAAVEAVFADEDI
ncbi:MAG: tandem-95 repeat protein, partial [Planctomycetales bacterium]|nr:tandem-95 repeat protein [Planctomycetales bacterium]